MRRTLPPLALVLLVCAGGWACGRDGFRCRASRQCVLDGVAGACEPTGSCSFPDPGCPAGRRYGAHAAAGLRGQCVEARRCGDGVLDPGEDCEDGNTADDDGCTSRCVRCTDGDARLAWPNTGACYTRHDELLDFSAALRACGERGGHLATFTSIYEQQAVDAALLGAPAGRLWIGLADRRQQGLFEWVTEEPFLISRWAPGQPGEATGRDRCASVGLVPAADGGHSLAWRSEGCRERLGYLCERPPAVVRPADGHAYRALHLRFRWREAEQACAALGGHLAVITSEEEHTFVAGHFFGGLWIGANDLEEEGTFRWVTGEPLGFRRFAPTEPDNFGGHHHCLMIAGDRLWHDRPCGERNAALCEIAP